MRIVTASLRIVLSLVLAVSLSLPAVPVLGQEPDPLHAQTPAVTVFLPGVMNGLEPGSPVSALRNAYNTLVEFAALKQIYMIEVVKTFTNGYTAGFMEPQLTYEQVDGLFALQADLWSRQDKVESAIATIEASQAQGSAAAAVSAQGIGSAMKGFWDWLSGSGERSRDRVLTVASNYNEAQRQQLYDHLRPEWKGQAADSEDFWQKFQAGDFDNQAPQIFNDLYHDPDLDFGLDAQDKNLTIQKIVHREGAEGVTKGAELMVEVVKTATPLGEGMDLVEDAAEYAEKIETALTDPKEFIADEIKDAIADKLGGFVDIDGLVDAAGLGEAAGKAIKILTDACLGSDDPADWFKDALDWGIGQVLDANQKGDTADIAVAENQDPSDLVQVMISLLETINLAGDKEITIGLPEGDWQITAVNPKGNTDSVEAEITKGISTLVVTNTDPEAGHVGDQLSLSVWISPANPGAGVGVTVYAKISPARADEAIYFSIVGTDGYSDSGTYSTDSDGVATFYVPGGAEAVVDTIIVRIESTGLTRTFTYTFA